MEQTAAHRPCPEQLAEAPIWNSVNDGSELSGPALGGGSAGGSNGTVGSQGNSVWGNGFYTASPLLPGVSSGSNPSSPGGGSGAGGGFDICVMECQYLTAGGGGGGGGGGGAGSIYLTSSSDITISGSVTAIGGGGGTGGNGADGLSKLYYDCCYFGYAGSGGGGGAGGAGGNIVLTAANVTVNAPLLQAQGGNGGDPGSAGTNTHGASGLASNGSQGGNGGGGQIVIYASGTVTGSYQCGQNNTCNLANTVGTAATASAPGYPLVSIVHNDPTPVITSVAPSDPGCSARIRHWSLAAETSGWQALLRCVYPGRASIRQSRPARGTIPPAQSAHPCRARQ